MLEQQLLQSAFRLGLDERLIARRKVVDELIPRSLHHRRQIIRLNAIPFSQLGVANFEKPSATPPACIFHDFALARSLPVHEVRTTSHAKAASSASARFYLRQHAEVLVQCPDAFWSASKSLSRAALQRRAWLQQATEHTPGGRRRGEEGRHAGAAGNGDPVWTGLRAVQGSGDSRRKWMSGRRTPVRDL